MNPTPRQLQILRHHLAGPQPFTAAASRAERTLLACGLISFNRGKSKTRLTQRGRRRLASYELASRNLVSHMPALPISLEMQP